MNEKRSDFYLNLKGLTSLTVGAGRLAGAHFMMIVRRQLHTTSTKACSSATGARYQAMLGRALSRLKG